MPSPVSSWPPEIPPSYAHLSAYEVECRLGIHMSRLVDKAVSLDRLFPVIMGSLPAPLKPATIHRVKDQVYERIVEHIATEGLPTAVVSTSPGNMSSLAVAILKPILVAWKNHASLSERPVLARQKFVKVTSNSEGILRCTASFAISILAADEKRLVFVVDAVPGLVWEAVRVLLLAMKDAWELQRDRPVYGFSVTGDEFMAFRCGRPVMGEDTVEMIDGGYARNAVGGECGFWMSRRETLMVPGMWIDKESWIKEYSCFVDTLFAALERSSRKSPALTPFIIR